MTEIAPSLAAYHTEASKAATAIYVAGMEPEPLAVEWRIVTRNVRKEILRAIFATDFLRNIYGALIESGRYALVLRHMFAPPISQDQLKLIAPLYPKQAEKKGTRFSKAAAQEFSCAFLERRDRHLTPWLQTNLHPTKRQIKRLIDTVTPMISSQIFNTVRRNRLSDEQERAIEELLVGKGWAKAASIIVRSPADLVPLTYMRKTKCQSSTTATKEVDIACGISANLILAMECKVSNDATNSVKRVSDVIDKVKSWKDNWGNFIQTAALLQGVVAYKDVARLLNLEVEVFWSHDLDAFSEWLDARA